MKIAIVLTVKNESRILRKNLLYHKAIGVDKAFVYFDSTADNGRESIMDLDFVSTFNSVAIEKYSHLDYLNRFTSQAAEHHTARQCLNTFDAQQNCKKEHVDWLISLDADELLCTDFDIPSDLKSFFRKIDDKIEVVNFGTMEVLQQKCHYENVFAEETLFKSNGKAFCKNIFNPFTKSKQKFRWWYGQDAGKGAIRINREVIPHNVHYYKKIDGSNLIMIMKGNVLHYHAYDSDDFIKKFSNFSNRPNILLSGGKVEGLKLLLRDVVNSSGFSQEELEIYFSENLLFGEKEIVKIKKARKYLFFKIKTAPIQKVQSVKMTFKNLKDTI